VLDKANLLLVKWSQMSATRVFDLHRALGHVGKLRAGWRGRPFRLHGARPPETLEALHLDDKYPLAEAGRVVFVGKPHRLLCVRCSPGWITFDRVYYDGRKAMTAVDFYNGFMSKFERDVELHLEDGRLDEQ